jgi:KDO2-lipid IV(A) lauroyltransferase
MTLKEKKEIATRVFYNLLQIIVGMVKRKTLDKEGLLSPITFENDHILQKAIKDQKKIIFITAHYSNWELLAPVLASKYNIQLAIVGRKLDSKPMNKILVDTRERFGVEMIYRKGAMKGMIKALKQHKAVGLLLDQNLREKQGGIKVSFFNKPAGHSPAASVLARSLDATIIPVFIQTDDYLNYTVKFYTPLRTIKTEHKDEDIRQMTQAQADITQHVITQRPQEWFWVHKRWKAYLPELYR